LLRWAKAGATEPRQSQRAKVILFAVQGVGVHAVSRQNFSKRRSPGATERLSGLKGPPGPVAPSPSGRRCAIGGWPWPAPSPKTAATPGDLFQHLNTGHHPGGILSSKEELVDGIMRYIRNDNAESAHPFRWTYTGMPLAVYDII
jgi:hypothetical protein